MLILLIKLKYYFNKYGKTTIKYYHINIKCIMYTYKLHLSAPILFTYKHPWLGSVRFGSKIEQLVHH